MRVSVIDTNKLTSVMYYDVEQILFDRDNTATLIFYTGEIKKYLPNEYTDIDCKKAIMNKM